MMTPRSNLATIPQLEAFEDRTVPAQLGLNLGIELAGLTAHVEVVATVETADKADHRLKAWLSEDNLYADDHDHSEVSGHEKKAEHAELNNHAALAKLEETLTTVILIKIKPKDHSDPPRSRPGEVEAEEPMLHSLPVEMHEHPHAHGEPLEHHIFAPVPEEAAAATPTASEAARPPQPGEVRPGAPLIGPRAAPTIPALEVAPGQIIEDAPGSPVRPAPEIVADATVAPPAAEPASTWAPAVVQVADLVSRFVPLDADSVEASVDQFLSQLRMNNDFGLSPRQAGLLTAALAVGLASGEFARRKHLPRRVVQMLSRTRW